MGPKIIAEIGENTSINNRRLFPLICWLTNSIESKHSLTTKFSQEELWKFTFATYQTLVLDFPYITIYKTCTVQQALRVQWGVFGVFVYFDLYFVNYRSWQAEILQERAEGCIQVDLQKKIRQD